MIGGGARSTIQRVMWQQTRSLTHQVARSTKHQSSPAQSTEHLKMYMYQNTCSFWSRQYFNSHTITNCHSCEFVIKSSAVLYCSALYNSTLKPIHWHELTFKIGYVSFLYQANQNNQQWLKSASISRICGSRSPKAACFLCAVINFKHCR